MENITNNITPIAISANNIPVFAHPESHSHRPDLNAEAINKINLPEDNTFFRCTVDMGRVIGKDHLVETEKDDLVFYWKRGNRPGESKMVLKDADDTQYVTVIACVAREEEGTPAELVGKWILVTLFEGCPGEREIFDRSFEKKYEDEKVMDAYRHSCDFWRCHALVPTEEELEQIKNTKGWQYGTYEDGEAYNYDFNTFDECIQSYNNALALVDKEWWMEGVTEPQTID